MANDGYDAAVPVPVPMSRQGSGRSAPNGSDPTSIRIVPLIGAIVLTLCAVYFIGSRLVAPKIEQGHLEQDVPETNFEAKSPSLEFEEPPPEALPPSWEDLVRLGRVREPSQRVREPSQEEIDKRAREVDARRAARRTEWMNARTAQEIQEILDQTLLERSATSGLRRSELNGREQVKREGDEADGGTKLDFSSAWRALQPSTPSPVEEKAKQPETFTVNVKIADPKRSKQSAEND